MENVHSSIDINKLINIEIGGIAATLNTQRDEPAGQQGGRLGQQWLMSNSSAASLQVSRQSAEPQMPFVVWDNIWQQSKASSAEMAQDCESVCSTTLTTNTAVIRPMLRHNSLQFISDWACLDDDSGGMLAKLLIGSQVV